VSDAHGQDTNNPPTSPTARRVAQELGVDLSLVSGTGPRGRIVRADVEAAAARISSVAAGDEAPATVATAAPTTTAGSGGAEVVAPSRLQRAIARRMVEAKTTAPDFVLVTEVEMEATIALRAELKALLGSEAPSLNDVIIKACAHALREFPYANGSWSEEGFLLHEHVNIGVAVASEQALVVPVVADADRRSLREVAAATRTLAQRVREGAITNAELEGATFTVSNLGMYGIRRFTAVLNPPQAAILAVGAAVPRMRLHDGAPAMRRVCDLSLTCDHRILYGAGAAQFLVRIRALLESPAVLLAG
jgi:pyruvate dehydrogenase E2 component (dihydrolipoamide acetyltransferase)